MSPCSQKINCDWLFVVTCRKSAIFLRPVDYVKGSDHFHIYLGFDADLYPTETTRLLTCF